MHVDLGAVWFVLVGVLVAAYAILDGFDLGAGTLHLLVARSDGERRAVMTSPGPVWDGNEALLVAAAAALCAAFPRAYATTASAFWPWFLLVAVALVVRAVSVELRRREKRPGWCRGWDIAFSVSSVLVAVVLGAVLGNVVRGLPLGADGSYRAGFAGLINPFALVCGALGLAVAVLQGAAWLVLNADGAVRDRALRAQAVAGVGVVVSCAAVTAAGAADAPRIFDNFANPLAWAGPVLFAHAVAFTLWSRRRRRAAVSFLFSALTIAGLAIAAGTALYPNLLPAEEMTRNLTIANAASSEGTLSAMLVVAPILLPFAFLYAVFARTRFRGRTPMQEPAVQEQAEAAAV